MTSKTQNQNNTILDFNENDSYIINMFDTFNFQRDEIASNLITRIEILEKIISLLISPERRDKSELSHQIDQLQKEMEIKIETRDTIIHSLEASLKREKEEIKYLMERKKILTEKYNSMHKEFNDENEKLRKQLKKLTL